MRGKYYSKNSIERTYGKTRYSITSSNGSNFEIVESGRNLFAIYLNTGNGRYFAFNKLFCGIPHFDSLIKAVKYLKENLEELL